MDSVRRGITPVVMILLVACSGGGDGTRTPAVSTGPAFDMAVLREVTCPPGTEAQLCFKVKVTNLGNAPGSGTCELRATIVSDTGDVPVFDGEVPVRDLAPGSDVVAIVGWTRPVPNPPVFGGHCEPGLRA